MSADKRQTLTDILMRSNREKARIMQNTCVATTTDLNKGHLMYLNTTDTDESDSPPPTLPLTSYQITFMD